MGRWLRRIALVIVVVLLIAILGVTGLYLYQVRGITIRTNDVAAQSVAIANELYRFTWYEQRHMPTARLEMCSTFLGEKLHAIGGIDGLTRTIDVHEVYDHVTQRWVQAAPLPEPRHHAAAVTVGQFIYVMGGYTGIDFKPRDDVFRYDAGGDKWERLTPMPTARGGGGAVAYEGEIYYVGGIGEEGVDDSLHVYDIATDTWTSREPMPTARDHFAFGIKDGKIYVAGGRKKAIEPTLDRLEIYDIENDLWSTGPAMPGPRGGCSGAFIQGLFIVTGGEESGGTRDTVEAYAPEAEAWYELPPLPTTRHSHNTVADVASDSVVVLGGGKRPSLSISGIHEVLQVEDEAVAKLRDQGRNDEIN